MASRTILLSAGGTGGHLFPAEALAHEMEKRGWTAHLATDSRAGRFAGGFAADRVHAISSATIGGGNPLKLVRSFLALWTGFRQASALIARLDPAIVVGFGGYPTLPPLFAATRRKVPTLLHEQNAVMGRANRALASRVDAIAGGFLAEGEGPYAARIILTGNPIRPPVIAAMATPYVPPAGDGPFRLLVFGGSQGAQFFSQSIPEAIALLDEPLRRRMQVVQQARGEDEAQVRAAYARLGIAAEISPFFSDMADRIAKTHLVISRSGASTVSEIAAIGRPAVLVPYPHALDHDQSANAAALAAAGGAEVRQQSTLDASTIAGIVSGFAAAPEGLADMAAAARRTGKPDAATLLADLAEGIAAGQSVAEFRKARIA